MAEAIATAIGVNAKSVTRDVANEMCGHFTAQFLELETRGSNTKARRELGWSPEPKYSLCDDILHGSYKPLAEQLKREAKVVR